MRIETERLIITEMNMDMAMDVHKNSLDEDIRRFVPDEVFETLEEAQETVEFIMSQYGSSEGPLIYAVIRKEDNKNIGYVQLVPIGEGKWEIGYHVAKPYTKKGYATEAVKAFLPVISRQVGITEVYGIRLLENKASGRVLDKCGFRTFFTGEGAYHDGVYEISKGVWKMEKKGMDLTFLNQTDYILDVWTKSVSDNPRKLVLTDERHPQGLSRSMVDELSGRVYGWLKEKQVGREDFVLLCLPRGATALISMLGVWKAGAAFTLVEDNYPPERIAYIRKDCNCQTVINIDTWKEILKTPPKEGFERTDIHDAAFVIYTSGTTGNPKGVLHEYGSLKLIQAASADRRTGKQRYLETDRLSLITPLNFNASIRRYVNALYDGFHVHILPYSTIKNPVLLRQYLQDKRITVLCASPSLLRMIGDPGPYVRQIQISSEPANGYYIEGPELVNAYAMSESAFPLAEFIIDKPYNECPVGKPNIDQIVVRILDENGNEVPDTEPGEITMEDPFFRGYINLPEQTKEAMRGGVYHTGDIGKKLPDGNIVLIGRMTDMIKINGNRIDPAEIEAISKKVLGVKWCAARGFEDVKHAFVCLYYTEDITFDEIEVRHQMEQYLPYYMIPSHFIKVDEVPMLPNGKMNRRALPKPEPKAKMADYEAPRTQTESILCKAFENALSVDRVGIHDNFYHLGGDSLRAMSVLAEADLQGLLASDIFEYCTPEQIAKVYEQREEGVQTEDSAAVEMREREKEHPLTPNQTSIFDYSIFSAKTIMWNLPRLYRFGADTDAEQLCDALNKAFANRTALYTVFDFNDECSLVQRIAPEKIVKIQVEKLTEEEFQKKSKDLLQPFQMIGEPLVHAGIYQTEEAVYLFFDVHHIMTDGSGMQLLNEDIVKAFRGEALPLDTYYAYLHNEEERRAGKKYREDRKFFEETYEQDDWCINLIPDEYARPAGRTFIPLKRVVTQEEIRAFEQKCNLSRNLLFTAVGLLAIHAIEKKDKVLVDWIFHDRTDEVRKNAFGCLFRYITVGLGIKEGMTLGEFFAELKSRSNDSLAHCSYEWSVKRNNVYEHDGLIVCYETAEIMSTTGIESIGGTRLNVESHAPINSRSLAFQIIENPDRITSYLMFNQQIYSKEKIDRAVDVFSDILDRIIREEKPDQMKIESIEA